MKTLIVKRIEPELHRRVKARAAVEGRTLRAVVLDLFQAYARGVHLPAAAQPRQGADAVLRLAGSIRVRGLAERIDEELYGE